MFGLYRCNLCVWKQWERSCIHTYTHTHTTHTFTVICYTDLVALFEHLLLVMKKASSDYAFFLTISLIFSVGMVTPRHWMALLNSRHLAWIGIQCEPCSLESIRGRGRGGWLSKWVCMRKPMPATISHHLLATIWSCWMSSGLFRMCVLSTVCSHKLGVPISHASLISFWGR